MAAIVGTVDVQIVARLGGKEFEIGMIETPIHCVPKEEEDEKLMPSLAKKAVLDMRKKTLTIDGQEFPWYISDDGVDVSGIGAANELAALHLTILVEDVEVIPKVSG